MKHQAKRSLALMLGVLLAAAVPARAGTIGFADVARLNVEGRRAASDMRLRAAQQQGGQTAASGLVSPQSGGTQGGGTAQPAATPADATTANAANADPLAVVQDPGSPQQQGGTVETVDLGDVTGTICDCGEIPFAAPRGLPLWPLLGLAGIPFLFLNRDRTPETPTNPTPPPGVIPEPATLMLFGSGLLALSAGARRRRARKTLEVEARDAEVA